MKNVEEHIKRLYYLVTIIIITHNPLIIANYAKEVIILKDGKKVDRVGIDSFLSNKKLQEIAAFTPP